MDLEQFKRRQKKIPDTPGVYFFLGKNKKILYIGKATSLRDRMRSYFAKDLMDTRGPLLVEMLEKATSIDWRQTDSVLEALLYEASLISTHKPYYNTDLKDDKSFNNVVITREDYPRVLVVRSNQLEPASAYRHIFGPFPHGMQLVQAMKLIRKIFPYRTKCEPNSGKRCFDAQLGLCPGVCSGEVDKKEYQKIIKHIVLLFNGKKKQLVASLEKEMKRAAKEEDFEEAARLRQQLFALTHIQDVSLIKDTYRPHTKAGENTRIEAYDIAHLGGSAHVGVMTVVEDGQANKMEYRKFRIRSAKGGDDPGALQEIISRRLGHDEWPYPRIIAVDGSTAQINAAQKVLDKYGIKIPIVGVVKDEKHRPRGILGDRLLIKDRERDILLANAEAHRFAIGFHRQKLRKKGLGI